VNKGVVGKVLVVEDDHFIRTTLVNTLESASFLVIAASSSREALEISDSEEVDVALLDIDLGLGPSGIDLAYALREKFPSIGIVFLTSYADARFADPRNKSLPKGSRYLVKSEIENLNQVISIVLHAKHKPFLQNTHHMNRITELTDLQVEVWKMVADGYSTAEIAQRRGISEKAVEATLSRLYSHFQIKRDKVFNPRILLINTIKSITGKK
jgi:DNA-binding NarL/FixJ family response regulator